MLFNTNNFLFIFLPISFIGYAFFCKINPRLIIGWLILCSAVFYLIWDLKFAPLIITSIIFNYYAGIHIQKTKSKKIFIFTIFLNIFTIFIFKYLNFSLSLLNIKELNIILPLGISFYTFTQIAYLVDSYNGKVKERNIFEQILFVTWFPHIIAGPILHHKQMTDQFRTEKIKKINIDSITEGIIIYSIGLAKKTLLADNFSEIADVFYNNPKEAYYTEVWIGVVAYTLQLYFDFSGYSDMAIGISKFFNIKLPWNFKSPYKSVNFRNFWRRWHITLSKFLRDYIYIPLGGNGKGGNIIYVNILITMLIAGIWHGAGINFIVWGAINGILLCFSHLNVKYKFIKIKSRFINYFIIFIVMTLTWIPFRANSFEQAIIIYKKIINVNQFCVPHSQKIRFILENYDIKYYYCENFIYTNKIFLENIIILLVGILFLYLTPNTQKIINYYKIFKNNSLMMASFSLYIALILYTSVISFTKYSPFIYYQF